MRETITSFRKHSILGQLEYVQGELHLAMESPLSEQCYSISKGLFTASESSMEAVVVRYTGSSGLVKRYIVQIMFTPEYHPVEAGCLKLS